MPNRVTVLTFGPGIDDKMRTLPVEESNVVIDHKRKEAVVLVDDPTDYILGKRITPFGRTRTVYSSFSGDGEALVVSAESTDYRSVEEYEEQLDEDTIVKKLRVEAVIAMKHLTATAKKAALIRAREDRKNPQQNQVTVLTTLVAAVISVVLTLYVLTFVNHNGGLGATLFPATEAAGPTVTPGNQVGD